MKLLAFIAIVYLVKVFLFPFYRPVSKKQKESTRAYAATQKAEEEKRKKRENNKRLAKSIAKPFMSQITHDNLKRKLERINDDRLPEELRDRKSVV